jgi:hypothetical protein
MTLPLCARIIMCEFNVKKGRCPESCGKYLSDEMIIYYDIKYENRINKVIFLLQT